MIPAIWRPLSIWRSSWPHAGQIMVVAAPLGLLQPETHVHLAVHRRRGAELLLGLLALAGTPVQLAEAEMAVGGERQPTDSSKAFASRRSSVSNPSVNQP